MTTPTCGACRHFSIENAVARLGTMALLAETSGECRRYPPTLPPDAGTGRRVLPSAVWPILPASAWCGEFAARPAAPPLPDPYARPTGADR